jgi:hypothetical protein
MQLILGSFINSIAPGLLQLQWLQKTPFKSKNEFSAFVLLLSEDDCDQRNQR